MKILSYFLFICFINLCNSFTLINKKYCANLISIQYKYKLYMECDYYIDKNLLIYNYNDCIFSYINVESKKSYYNFIPILDEDEIEVANYEKDILKTSMKSIVIYNNNTFNKLSFENKYKKIIEDELNLLKKTLNDVNKIVKIEKIYKRI